MRSALCIALGAVALTATPAAADRPPLRAKLVTCATGPESAGRYAVFTGSMPAIPGAARLEMRFDLLQRHGDAVGYARVPLPKWGGWEHTERRGSAGFIFTKRVEQLSAPATYRAVIRFRWIDADGDVIRTAKRFSAPCREQDPRPDLGVGSLTGTDDGRYLVELVNDGRSDSGPFDMSLGVGDATSTVLVPALSAGERRTVAINGKRCASGELVNIALDTGGDVQEADELDDAVTRPCPFG